MTKFSQMDKDFQTRVNEYVRYRWDGLERSRASLEEHAIKYLFGTNAGGTAVLLAFIGSTNFSPATSVISLVLFLIGLFLVGIGIATGYHRINGLQRSWNNDANELFSNNVDWETMIDRDKQRVEAWAPGKIIAWASFGCSISGTAFGFASFLLYLCKS